METRAHPILRRISTLLGYARTRQFLLWCLPALITAIVLRVVLTVHLPYGIYHDDSGDFLLTPDQLLKEGEWELHGKKTFLVPALFTVPFLLRIPALIAIPIFHHLLGILLVLLVGLLCRLWFDRWKIFIVPVTLLTAVNPFMLWYEHTLMAETTFIFCTLLVALAGTLYTIRQTRAHFAFLCVSLVLEAGARPEGKLLFGLGLLVLVLVHWTALRSYWPRLATLLAIALTTHLLTKTSQAGLLLYTSVVRITPPELSVAPGFPAYIAPLQADLQQRWDERPSFPRVRDRRVVSDTVERYLKETQHPDGKNGRIGLHGFCMKLAMETCLRNLSYLPALTYHKFRLVASDAPSGNLENLWLFENQQSAFLGAPKRNFRLSKGLTGTQISDAEEYKDFLERHYGEVPWLNTLHARWLAAGNSFRLPDQTFKIADWPYTYTYPGIPLYFLFGTIGLVAVCFRRGVIQPFHLAWCITILGFFFVIMLTANVRPRFRFVFEPLWVVYIAFLLDTVWTAFRARSGDGTPQPSEAPTRVMDAKAVTSDSTSR